MQLYFSSNVIFSDMATASVTPGYMTATTAGVRLPSAGLETWDVVVIAVYFAVVLAVGLWVSNWMESISPDKRLVYPLQSAVSCFQVKN